MRVEELMSEGGALPCPVQPGRVATGDGVQLGVRHVLDGPPSGLGRVNTAPSWRYAVPVSSGR